MSLPEVHRENDHADSITLRTTLSNHSRTGHQRYACHMPSKPAVCLPDKQAFEDVKTGETLQSSGSISMQQMNSYVFSKLLLFTWQKRSLLGATYNIQLSHKCVRIQFRLVD